jgi:predicted nucleic acid-binding protein
LIRFVLDASVALAWFVDNPVSPYATRVKKALLGDTRAVVPALWHLEMANGLVAAERCGILSVTDASQGMALIEQLLTFAIESTSDLVSLRETMTTSRAFQLTAYDAVYLDTSRRERLPLATLDRRLIAAAARAGVEVIA